MKKIIYIFLLFMFCLFPSDVFASGYISISDTTVTITKGSSKKFTITAYNAIGDVTIKSKDTNIATVSSSLWSTGIVGDGETKKGTITINAVNVGSTVIELVIDGASFDEVNLSTTKTINVNVVEPVVDNRSKNNNLKSLSVDGYQLVKVNNNNYTLIVSNDVTSINVNATAEDVKAKVSGVGRHELKVGENTITVVITAENQSKNNITIKVTRKDGYYLTDLDKELQDDSKDELDIVISNDSKISNDNLEKIKNSGKKVKFNYFDENKKVLYSWIIEGSKINNLNEFVTTIVYDSENVEKISELSNYADGIYVNFKHEGNLPNNTKIKLYVGDKFKNNNLLNIYHYAGDSLKLVKDKVTVVDGYIEFELEHCSEYLVTRSMLNKKSEESKSSIDISWIIVGVEFIVIIVLGILLLNKNKYKSKNIMENKLNNVQENNAVYFEDKEVAFLNNEDNENK